MVSIVRMFALCLCFVVSALAQTNVIYLSGVIRDQAPDTINDCTPNGSAGTANGGYGFDGTDFELPLGSYQNDEKGLVGAQCDVTNSYTNCGQIGADYTPVYAYAGTSPGKNVQSPASFYNWFHDTAQTEAIPYSLPLTEVTPGVYRFISTAFFPIDNAGWEDHCNGHNYEFCFEAHANFGYEGGETIAVTANDDTWVYINGQLVIDLGSLHTSLAAEVNLDDIPGLVEGNIYRFDFFHCNRHTVSSTLEITTTAQVS